MPPKAFKPPRMSTSSAKSAATSASHGAKPSADFSSSPSRSPSPAPRTSTSAHRRESGADVDDSAAGSLGQAPLLPAALLTRLLDHHFQDSKTRVSAEANLMIGKYLDTFVREALARAKYEMDEKKGGQGGDFLEVEDLERLAPQLCLDF